MFPTVVSAESVSALQNPVQRTADPAKISLPPAAKQTISHGCNDTICLFSEQ
jgi:hypothetical protein